MIPILTQHSYTELINSINKLGQEVACKLKTFGMVTHFSPNPAVPDQTENPMYSSKYYNNQLELKVYMHFSYIFICIESSTKLLAIYSCRPFTDDPVSFIKEPLCITNNRVAVSSNRDIYYRHNICLYVILAAVSIDILSVPRSGRGRSKVDHGFCGRVLRLQERLPQMDFPLHHLCRINFPKIYILD